MTDDINEIDQEELDRLEDVLLEEEARKREEKMIIEGRSVFEIERLKNLRTEERKNKGTSGGEMSKIFRFRDFQVYKDARHFRKLLKELSIKKFPKNEQFCLTSQIWRALDSILLNIAEGSEKYSDIDFSRFLNIALGSLNEVVACLDVAFDDKYISDEELDQYRTYAIDAKVIISAVIARNEAIFLKEIAAPSHKGEWLAMTTA